VTAEDVVEAVQGQIAMNRCLLGGATDCENAGSCPVQRRLDGIQRDVKKALQGVTLGELASDMRKALR
jgi:DNA-binding IscR family transcriptional regulator